MYQNIMFDLDGTVTDSGRAIMSSVEYALEQMGIEDRSEKKLRAFIGPSLYDSFTREFRMTEEDCQKAISLYRSIYENERMYDVEIYDGIPKLLDNLKKQGRTLLLITSKPFAFSVKIIEKIGLSQYFDHVTAPGFSDHSSDKKILIERAINEFGLKRSECIMIGDTEYDIRGAADAGIHSIAVTYGYGKPERLVESRPTYMVESVKDIGKIL